MLISDGADISINNFDSSQSTDGIGTQNTFMKSFQEKKEKVPTLDWTRGHNKVILRSGMTDDRRRCDLQPKPGRFHYSTWHLQTAFLLISPSDELISLNGIRQDG